MKLFIVNDDVNSFEHVTRCIQKYLNYPYMQAVSITNIVDNAGECEVKNSEDETLIKSLYMELIREGLNLKIVSENE
jgi:ATP-dependent Clp protease adapter protein ClpS|tara:strand:+ start:503 stop:733 length:231 start_codon:yes stop_codon:yes gene_type:complete